MADCVSRHDPERIILLGDILYHGPRNPLPEGYDPGAAAALIASFKERILAIKGNCDSEVDESVLGFPFMPLFTWIADGPLRICATHGHHFGPQHLPPLEAGDALVYGHTHVAQAERSPEGIFLCNPGSPSLPKRGTPPTYGLFNDGLFQVLTADGAVYKEVACS